ncbi:hypothetical protein [Nocardioides sp. YIM 152315]|uniref:hypothetical protein n=1 Tax=Nocardioides sp. YIM 152315 TaxID=3031760 RepID=UPI0023DA8588|nr:hypothetical protein [Nocardioides sp. YIM 152315]MDF1604186.1 hypothetical protein [Nocardioides sp. YIM 152315]
MTWPVAPAAHADVRFSGVVGEGWTPLGSETLGRQTTARWAGAVSGEGLVVTLLTGATADGDLAGWLDLPMAVTGVDPQTVPVSGAGEVVTWGEAPDFLTVPDADQQLARSGLVRFVPHERARPELLRGYVLLARRGDVAWKVAYSLSSAVLPGASADEVDLNDHARARELFGPLRLG